MTLLQIIVLTGILLALLLLFLNIMGGLGRRINDIDTAARTLTVQQSNDENAINRLISEIETLKADYANIIQANQAVNSELNLAKNDNIQIIQTLRSIQDDIAALKEAEAKRKARTANATAARLEKQKQTQLFNDEAQQSEVSTAEGD